MNPATQFISSPTDASEEQIEALEILEESENLSTELLIWLIVKPSATVLERKPE